MPIVRIYGLKQEGDELFMKDFRKRWRYNEGQWRITDKETMENNAQSYFHWFPENQSVVFAIQPVVFISS